MRNSYLPYVKTAAKFAVAIFLTFWVVQRGALDPKALKIAFEPTAFLLLGGLALGQVMANNARWLFLLKGQGFETTLKRTLPLTLMGLFFNYAMPGSVGGDIIKGYYLAQDHPEQKLAAGVSVFMDRLIGFFVMVLSGSLAILMFRDRLDHDPRLVAIGTGTLLVTIAFIVILAFSLSRRLQSPLKWLSKWLERMPGHRLIEEIYRAMHAYRYRTRELWIALLLSALNQVLLVLFFYVAADLLGEGRIPLSVFWFCIPIGLVAQAVPITPAGVGVGQAVFYFLFQAALEQPTQVGTVGITLIQIFQFLLGLIGAIYYLRRGSKRIPVDEEGIKVNARAN
jgi:uncharacterized protein (TIRG00374 family)